MDGAGKPCAILGSSGISCTPIPTQQILNLGKGSEFLQIISDWINEGLPVICRLESSQINGFSHAVVLFVATKNGAALGYKDPARLQSNSARYVNGLAFLEGSLIYAVIHNNTKDIYAYCSEITFVGGNNNELTLLKENLRLLYPQNSHLPRAIK
jgi:hypothetical protein